MFSKIELVKRRIRKIVRLAEKLYGLKIYDKLMVEIKKRNRITGWAIHDPDHEYPFYIGFNIDCILGSDLEFDYVYNNTIPHEIAHLVCDILHPNKADHCKEWKEICIKLGGNGAARGPSYMIHYDNGTYRYTTKNGNQYHLSKIAHNRIQNEGLAYIYKGNNRIDDTCEFEEL